MFNNISDEHIRSICKSNLETLEKWLRNLIEYQLSSVYGLTYYDHVDENSNRLIKAELVKSCKEKIKKEPTRFTRFIDAAFLDDLIEIICKPNLFKRHFQSPFKLAYPIGREQAKETMTRLLTPRNHLAHSNHISLRQAEQVICYSHDIIDSIKSFYESINMEKEYNVPSIINYSDSFGNKIYSSQFLVFGAKKLIGKDKLSKHKLYPGDEFYAKVEIDESFEQNSYKVRWLFMGKPSISNIEEQWGNQISFTIQETHVNENFKIECYVYSDKNWHRFGKHDDFLRIIYQILPIK